MPLPRVIALAPGVVSRTPTAAGEPPGALVLAGKPQLVELVAALSTVAVAAGRTLAVPQLSCDFPWVRGRESWGAAAAPSIPLGTRDLSHGRLGPGGRGGACAACGG